MQAAGNRANMSYGSQVQMPVAEATSHNGVTYQVHNAASLRKTMNQKEQAMLAECRERVLACGFPDLDVLGWALKITPILDDSGASTVREAIFISPQVTPVH